MNYKGLKDKVYNCLYCNKDIPFRGYSADHKYCDNACSASHRREVNINSKKKMFEEGRLASRKYIYEFLVERDTNKCSVCDITEWNDKEIRLWVDHIDGNAANNDPSNFRLICPNCDSQSETFGAKNKGNGRRSRGMRPYG